jgi:hypothetical protein
MFRCQRVHIVIERSFHIDLPMPVCTPRLLIRPKRAGDGALTSVAVAETWEDFNADGLPDLDVRWGENR